MSVLELAGSLYTPSDDVELSLENIKNRFNDKVAKEIESEFSRIKRESKGLSTKMLNDSRIPSLIEANFGIELQLRVIGGDNAGVPYKDFSITANAPLSPESNYAFSANGKSILKGKKSTSIVVNKVTGFISGIKGIKHTIPMGRELLIDGKYTTREAMAIFLHELGHIWTYYLTLPHIFITNFIAGEYAERFVEVKSEEARTELIQEASNTFRMEVLEKERLLVATKKEEVAVIMFTSQLNKLKSIMGSNPYDTRNAEAMADQFVIRFGYGKDLATGLAKDNSGSTKNYSWSKAIWYAVDYVCFSVVGAPLVLLISCFFPDIHTKKEYDDPVKRIEVILHGLRDRLKSAHTREDKRIILSEIDLLESYLKENTDNYGLFAIMYNHIIPWGRGRHSAVNFQKAMEALQNNSLNSRAEKLKELL